MSSSTNPTLKRLCPHCQTETPQSPLSVKVTGQSCTLVCNICNNTAGVLTFDEMMAAIAQKFAHEPPLEVTPIDISRMRVFVKHHMGEAELPPDAIREHVRITGKSPVVGEKLYALPKGLTHKAFALPISDVVRIENI